MQVSILSLSAVLTQLQQWRPQLVLHFPFNKHPSGLILACGFTFGNAILHSHQPEMSGRPLVAAIAITVYTLCSFHFNWLL